MAYRIMTFQSNGMPMPLENEEYETEEEAKTALNKLKDIYNVQMYISEK